MKAFQKFAAALVACVAMLSASSAFAGVGKTFPPTPAGLVACENSASHYEVTPWPANQPKPSWFRSVERFSLPYGQCVLMNTTTRLVNTSGSSLSGYSYVFQKGSTEFVEYEGRWLNAKCLNDTSLEVMPVQPARVVQAAPAPQPVIAQAVAVAAAPAVVAAPLLVAPVCDDSCKAIKVAEVCPSTGGMWSGENQITCNKPRLIEVLRPGPDIQVRNMAGQVFPVAQAGPMSIPPPQYPVQPQQCRCIQTGQMLPVGSPTCNAGAVQSVAVTPPQSLPHGQNVGNVTVDARGGCSVLTHDKRYLPAPGMVPNGLGGCKRG